MTAHHFTVDVEEYFQVSAFESVVHPEQWESMESRVVPSMAKLLDLLGAHGARGTFFVLGWLADRNPDLVRLIAEAGHEVASHGWDHRRVTHQDPTEFRASVRRSKNVLEDITGSAVLGFRAPSFSIVPGREWALDILSSEGYRYDSSLFPVRRPGYGYAGGRRDPHWLEGVSGKFAEVPPATLRYCGTNIPAAGGAYFRLFPYGLVRSALLDSGRRGIPATFYIHPWEWDPGQPRMSVSLLTRVRHYSGLRKTWGRLERLVKEFRFVPIAETVAAL